MVDHCLTIFSLLTFGLRLCCSGPYSGEGFAPLRLDSLRQLKIAVTAGSAGCEALSDAGRIPYNFSSIHELSPVTSQKYDGNLDCYISRPATFRKLPDVSLAGIEAS